MFFRIHNNFQLLNLLVMLVFANISRMWILCTMVLIFSPVYLFAQDDDANLINITTLEQLDAMRYDLDGDGVVDAATNAVAYDNAFGTPSCLRTSACTGYELMNNLDFAGTKWAKGGLEAGGWKPIGDGTLIDPNNQTGSRYVFTAIFNGGGNTISNLYIDRTAFWQVCLERWGPLPAFIIWVLKVGL